MNSKTYIFKNNKTNVDKQKKKSIPININLNPGQFLFKNNINKIASSYISMGRKIQTRKNRQLSKMQVNTNSVSNCYQKQTTSYILNNSKNSNNKSEYNYINKNNNNYNINYSIQNIPVNQIEKNKIKFKRIIYSKDRRQLSTSSNTNISRDLFSNGYRTSINNTNNTKIKNKIINLSNEKENISKNQENYSSRVRYLDSRNKTKKISMKSKLQHLKSKKQISTSYAYAYTTKRKIRDNSNSNINNRLRIDLFKKIEKINGKNYRIIQMNKKLYKIQHLRHNTANIGQKEIMNILHKRTLSNKFTNINNVTGNTINNINNININNNIYINNDKNININKLQKSLNKNIENNSRLPIFINKINYNINSKEKFKRTNKTNNNDIQIYIKEKKLKLKDNNISSKLQNKYFSNNIPNFTLIPGVKNITIKSRDNKISKKNKTDIYNHIPIPSKKLKKVEIPSQRNIKLNYVKISQNFKQKKINKKLGRKSETKKENSKREKSDFSLSKIKANSLIQKNEDISDLKTSDIKRNINFDERIQEIKNISKDINNLSDINYISNVNNNISENKINYSKKEELAKCQGKTDSNYSIDNTSDIICINNKIYVNKKDSKNSYKNNKTNTNYSEEEKENKNEENECQEEIEETSKKENYDEIKDNLKNNKIINDLFEEENLEDLPEDYDEDFNDLYSIINKINFGRVLVGVEGFFTYEGKSYKRYKDKFDKFYDKLYSKKGNSYSNSKNQKKNLIEIVNMASNAKTNYSSSKKGLVNNN